MWATYLARMLAVAAALLVGCIPSPGCFDEACRPVDLAPFVVTDVDEARSEMAGGFLLLTQLDEEWVSYAAVIDGRGRHRWWYGPRLDRRERVLRARLSHDRQSVIVGIRHPDNSQLGGRIRWLNASDATVVREVVVEDHHHELVELDDGRVAYLSRRRVPDVWFGTEAPLAVDTVRVLGRDGRDEVVLDLLDDVGLSPSWTCSHMGLTEFVAGALDWTHTNSLVVDPDSGDMTLGIRHFDSALRVDSDGGVRWWMGAPPGLSTGFGSQTSLRHPDELEPLAGATRPRHGHFSEAWPDGMLVFDNGNHTTRPTRIVEYAVDEALGTYREVWSYVHPQGIRFGARGDALRLPGGNVLVAWSGIGEIWEITREGDVVWKADTAQKVLRMQFVEDW
ncbi:MAG: aryl-sulfate sulfotransferase [Myxococcota bacterium]